MPINEFESMLSGGHPNSLGRTIEVVEIILQDNKKLKDLLDCYKSEDEVVRLRVSNALKRICKQKPEWVSTYLDLLINDISMINQASTKWTLSTIFMLLDNYMNNEQRNKAIGIMKNNLTYDDWIVQNTTAESLAYFADESPELKEWLIPQLKSLTTSRHKSVSRRAQKLLDKLS